MSSEIHANVDSGGYIDDAVAGLKTSHVWVSSEVADAGAIAQAVQDQIGDASVGVAVFSDNAALEASGREIVSQLAAQTDYDTIIVAVGDDLSAGSRALPSGEAMRIANEAEAQAGSTQQALVETVQQVEDASRTSPATGGVDGGLVVGIALAVAALLAVGGGIVALRRRSRSQRRGRPASGALPAEVRPHVATLRELSREYATVGAQGNPVATETAQQLTAIATNTEELFARIDRRSGSRGGSRGRSPDGGGDRSLAEVEYAAKLGKLSAAVSRDYLLDILAHPDLWDDPGERTREVQGAVEAVSTELLENIRQVNASRGLHFQVSLDGLIGRRKELQDWDRAFGSASGGETP
ncbi:hypothetical protein [Microbacterium sp. bgisy203]|uniref:hypothetical protein n=1 Tax=Microbacterium sp. bgisy203 TaxID=3413799 RepID=UPI003D71F915